MKTSANQTSIKQNRSQRRSSAKPKKYSNKGKSGQRSSKDVRRFDEVADTTEAMISKSNPYTWYANFPNYAKDVATLAFGVPVGQPIILNDTGDWISSAGIMALHFTPVPGVTNDLTSPINRQATKFQTYLRSIQRAAAKYDAADTMMYMLSVDSLYTYWAMLRRIYGVAQLFTPTNKYYPKRLLQALNVDPSIAENLADFRAYINRFALNVGRFSMPKEFDITARHMWMCEGLYVDSDTTRAQTYVFVPYYFWKMDNTVSTGSQLTAVQFSSGNSAPTQYTFEQLVEFGNQLLNNIENDDDTMAISGDLYRAYGPSGLLKVEETVENYAVLPLYSETVLSQIENCTIVGQFVTSSSLTPKAPVIKQDPSINNGAIIFDPCVSLGHVVLPGLTDTAYGLNVAGCLRGNLLNAHKDAPSPEDVMEMTRLCAWARIADTPTVTTERGVYLDSCGSDLVNYVVIYSGGQNSQSAVSTLYLASNSIWFNDTTSQGTQSLVGYLQLLSQIMQFDWAPMLYLVEFTTADGALSTVNVSQIAADLDNFTLATSNQMFNIHEAAMLSLLDISEPIQH